MPGLSARISIVRRLAHLPPSNQVKDRPRYGENRQASREYPAQDQPQSLPVVQSVDDLVAGWDPNAATQAPQDFP